MIKCVSWERKERESCFPLESEKKSEVLPVNALRASKQSLPLSGLPANSHTPRRGRWSRKNKKLRESCTEKDPKLVLEEKSAMARGGRCGECQEKAAAAAAAAAAASRGRFGESEEKTASSQGQCGKCEEKSPTRRGHFGKEEEKPASSQGPFGKGEKPSAQRRCSEGMEIWKGQLKALEPLKSRLSEQCDRLARRHSEGDRTVLRHFSESSEDEDEEPASPCSSSPPVLTKPALKRKVGCCLPTL